MQRTPEIHPAIAGCLDAGERCLRLAQVLTPEQYARRLPNHDAIGSHMRHCLDYFVCLLRGLEGGLVDYDARDRDSRVASDPVHFSNCLQEALDHLLEACSGGLDRPLRLRQTVAADGRSWTVATTLERELTFLSGHCVHHLAITSLLAQLMGVTVSPELGKAYSTSTHEKTSPGS